MNRSYPIMAYRNKNKEAVCRICLNGINEWEYQGKCPMNTDLCIVRPDGSANKDTEFAFDNTKHTVIASLYICNIGCKECDSHPCTSIKKARKLYKKYMEEKS